MTEGDWKKYWTKLSLPPGKFVAYHEEPPEMIGGIIYMPEQSKTIRDEAIVLAVGPPYVDHNGIQKDAWVSPGDKILVNPNWGTEFRYEDKEADGIVIRKVRIYNFPDVIARINE